MGIFDVTRINEPIVNHSMAFRLGGGGNENLFAALLNAVDMGDISKQDLEAIVKVFNHEDIYDETSNNTYEDIDGVKDVLKILNGEKTREEMNIGNNIESLRKALQDFYKLDCQDITSEQWADCIKMLKNTDSRTQKISMIHVHNAASIIFKGVGKRELNNNVRIAYIELGQLNLDNKDLPEDLPKWHPLKILYNTTGFLEDIYMCNRGVGINLKIFIEVLEDIVNG